MVLAPGGPSTHRRTGLLSRAARERAMVVRS